MDNYRQKLFLLCTLLFGCLLTSVGVEYFTTSDEPIQIQVPKFAEEQPKNNKSNLISTAPFQKANTKNGKDLSKPTQPKQINATININTATVEELDTLPGIGPAIAKRIVEFRTQQPFTKIEDIMLVKGIGKKKFAKMRERIVVE